MDGRDFTTMGVKWRICMARRRIIRNPIPITNIIQEDNRIIELQNHIAKLENEIEIKDQLNEGLKTQLNEKQYEINETARMCNENATMVMNAQKWIRYFKNKYD